jgi:hypothetical protein
VRSVHALELGEVRCSDGGCSVSGGRRDRGLCGGLLALLHLGRDLRRSRGCVAQGVGVLERLVARLLCPGGLGALGERGQIADAVLEVPLKVPLSSAP